ncbi:MAG: hypothetical protein P8X81_09885 [Woeseiaceae bacterium]
MSDPVRRQRIAAASEISAVSLSERDVEDLLEFLYALTDPASIDLRADVPPHLPSGTTLAD